MRHNNFKKDKRFTINEHGRVVECGGSAGEALSIKASFHSDAECSFLKMARNVLFFKPRALISGNVFQLIYHDGLKYCVDTSFVDKPNEIVYHQKYDKFEEALNNNALKFYTSEEFLRSEAEFFNQRADESAEKAEVVQEQQESTGE